MDIKSFKMKVAKLLKLINPSRLVITRSIDQSIVVGNAVITIVQIKGKQVRVAVTTEADQEVRRLEVFEVLAACETKERFNDNKNGEAEGNSALGENSSS